MILAWGANVVPLEAGQSPRRDGVGWQRAKGYWRIRLALLVLLGLTVCSGRVATTIIEHPSVSGYTPIGSVPVGWVKMSSRGQQPRQPPQPPQPGPIPMHLPVEVLRHIFLRLDPHTLFTSIRSLNSHWQAVVQNDLIPYQFRTRRWKLGLRVSRHSLGSATAADGGQATTTTTAPSDQQQQPPPQPDARHIASRQEELKAKHAARTQRLLATPNVTEDQLDRLQAEHDRALSTLLTTPPSTMTSPPPPPPPTATTTTPTPPLLHVIPLTFQRYDSSTVRLVFSTEREWHALFRSLREDGADGTSDQSWLGLDFGFCWRWVGDDVPTLPSTGWEHIDAINREWGVPDEANGWLSRFWFVRLEPLCLCVSVSLADCRSLLLGLTRAGGIWLG